MQSINTVDLQKLMRTRSISKYHFQYRYVVFFEKRDYYATSARLSLSLSLTCFSKFANSLDPKDLRLLAKPNQGQTGIPRIKLVSERPTLHPMPRKNIISDIGFEPMRTIRWVHSFLKEKQKFIQVRTTNLFFMHAVRRFMLEFIEIVFLYFSCKHMKRRHS